MRVATPLDLVHVLIARIPVMLIAALTVWAAYAGLQQLELRSEGTTLLVPAAENIAPNDVAAAQRRTEHDLLDALNSGDTEQMNRALDRVDASGLTGDRALS